MKSRHSTTKVRLSRICFLVMSIAFVKFSVLMYFSFNNDAWLHEKVAISFEQNSDDITADVRLGATQNPKFLISQNSESMKLHENDNTNPNLTTQNNSTLVITQNNESITTGQTSNTHTAGDPVSTVDIHSSLARASSSSPRSGFGFPSLVATAHAQDMPAPNINREAPSILGSSAPSMNEVVRPDAVVNQNSPTPEVAPYISRDSSKVKEAELARKEQELLTLEQQMNARLDELQGLENRLQDMLMEANSAEDTKYQQLIDTYTNMKPRAAAASLSLLDEDIAVNILAGMDSKKSGEIFSYMDAENTARLSTAMTKMRF